MSEQIIPSLVEITEQEEKLKISKALSLEKAFMSNNIEDIYAAQSYIKNIEQKETQQHKSILVDPFDLSTSFGYKDKPHNLSYDLLRGMARTHIVKSIIETRKEQMQAFCEPQSNKYATGFIITKKQKFSQIGEEVKLTRTEQAKVEYLIQFILDCGTSQSFWHADTFDTFISKIIKDLLELDQATFEVQRNRKGDPIGFFATDAATFRVADTYMDNETETRYPEKVKKGYLPSHVQLYQSNVIAEFYPWELCFGVMNPQTDIKNNGYGRSPLEDMVQTVTSLLNSDAYNSNFFKIGSAPKGILKYSGNINQNTLDDFRQQWLAQVAGVGNSHKTPIINADKLDFINTHVPNKDMEFSKFQEFLIKITCAQYKIDPSEIGFNMQGESGNGGGLGKGGDQEEKVKFSKEKGLKPLLKRLQYWLNKYIVGQLDEDYELRFVGVDQDTDPHTELEQDIKLVSNIMTLNEVRAKRNLSKVEGGDVVLSPAFLQGKSMDQQQEMMKAQNNQGGDDDVEVDPFQKSLQEDLAKLLIES
jgi:Phage portal protein